jgi:hypothetical protein
MLASLMTRRSELDIFLLGIPREPLMDAHEAYQVP